MCMDEPNDGGNTLPYELYRLHEECEIWERYPQPNYITNYARTTEGALHKYAVFWVE